jgi:hypothetical protein
MEITSMVPVLDAANIDEVSTFWAGLLGGRVEASEDWHTVLVDDVPRLDVQLAPNHIRPEWPDGQPQQIHLDITVADIGAAHEHAMTLGAVPLGDSDRSAAQGFQVYADPAGHPFCLCWA